MEPSQSINFSYAPAVNLCDLGGRMIHYAISVLTEAYVSRFSLLLLMMAKACNVLYCSLAVGRSAE